MYHKPIYQGTALFHGEHEDKALDFGAPTGPCSLGS